MANIRGDDVKKSADQALKGKDSLKNPLKQKALFIFAFFIYIYLDVKLGREKHLTRFSFNLILIL